MRISPLIRLEGSAALAKSCGAASGCCDQPSLDRLQDQEAAVGDGLADVGDADVGASKDDVLDAKSESPADLLSLGCAIGVSRIGITGFRAIFSARTHA